MLCKTASLYICVLHLHNKKKKSPHQIPSWLCKPTGCQRIKEIRAADRCGEKDELQSLAHTLALASASEMQICKKHQIHTDDSDQNTALMLSKFRLEFPIVHANESFARQLVTECASRRPVALGLIAGNDSIACFFPMRAPPTEIDRIF